MNTFDASQPPEETPHPLSVLDAMLEQDALSRLEEVIARIDEFDAEMAAEEAEEDLDPEIVTLLEAVTGAEDAPLTFRSLHERVERGLLTWEDFWASPTEQADGMHIFQAVVAAHLQHVAELMDQQPPGDEPEGAAGPGVLD